jgi:hypothetical protein
MAAVTGFLAQFNHACRELAWRAGGVWQDFLDWIRTAR